MYSQFTDRSRKIMKQAVSLARESGEHHLGVQHIFLGLLQEGGGVAMNVLRNLAVDEERIRSSVVKQPQAVNKDVLILSQPTHDHATKQAIDYALKEAHVFNHNYIGTEHLLLGVLRVRHPLNEKVLAPAGITYEAALEEVKKVLGQPKCKVPSKEEIRGNYYRGVLNRILKICEENSDDVEAIDRIKKIAKRAMIDGEKGK